MKPSQTKRAIYTREWRVGRREKRRFNTLLSGYMSIKYQDIYNECWQFYNLLNQMYPEKHDLTKTREYERWKTELTKDESSESGEDNDTGPTTVTRTESTTTTTVRTEPIQDIAEIAVEPTTAMRTEPMQDIAEIAVEPTTAMRTEPMQDIAVEPTTAMRTESTTTSARTEPIQDILQIAAEGLLPDSPEIRNDIDNIIDDIIRDLQQDDALRAILDNDDLVQPHYMDEDEGIGLNTQTELEAIIEPFDYQLEVEGFDF